jgi:hypothetical protein
MPGTNDRQNKGSNDTVSLDAQLRIRINKKDIRIAALVSSRDLFQMKASLLEREADFRKLQSERVDAHTIKLQHAFMRLFSEQTAGQRALWTDEDRAVIVTPLSSPSLDHTAMPPVHAPKSGCLRTPFVTEQDTLCSVHGFVLDADGLPHPPAQHTLMSVPSANETMLLKLSLATVAPSPATAFVNKSFSHGTAWFTIGAVIMSLLVLLAVVKTTASPSISRRLATQDIYSLTISGILTAIAIVEVEHITELCSHEQRHLYNVLVTFTMGSLWCIQLIFALMNSTGSGVGRRATQAPSRLPSPASPPTNWRRKRWGGK